MALTIDGYRFVGKYVKTVAENTHLVQNPKDIPREDKKELLFIDAMEYTSGGQHLITNYQVLFDGDEELKQLYDNYTDWIWETDD